MSDKAQAAVAGSILFAIIITLIAIQVLADISGEPWPTP